MVKRIIAIAFIFVCASVAWAILGATIFQRTYNSDASASGQVASIWGAPHTQSPPVASYTQAPTRAVTTVVESVKSGVGTGAGSTPPPSTPPPEPVTKPLPLESSRIEVALNLEHRQIGRAHV